MCRNVPNLQCKPLLHPVRNIHPSSCSPAATASPFPFRHSQTLTNQIFDRPKIFRFKKKSYPFNFWQVKHVVIVIVKDPPPQTDSWAFWQIQVQVTSSDVSRTNRFWSIHNSYAPVAIAVFQLLPESNLPQITHWKLTSLDLQLVQGVQAATFSPRCGWSSAWL